MSKRNRRFTNPFKEGRTLYHIAFPDIPAVVSETKKEETVPVNFKVPVKLTTRSRIDIFWTCRRDRLYRSSKLAKRHANEKT